MASYYYQPQQQPSAYGGLFIPSAPPPPQQQQQQLQPELVSPSSTIRIPPSSTATASTITTTRGGEPSWTPSSNQQAITVTVPLRLAQQRVPVHAFSSTPQGVVCFPYDFPVPTFVANPENHTHSCLCPQVTCLNDHHSQSYNINNSNPTMMATAPLMQQQQQQQQPPCYTAATGSTPVETTSTTAIQPQSHAGLSTTISPMTASQQQPGQVVPVVHVPSATVHAHLLPPVAAATECVYYTPIIQSQQQQQRRPVLELPMYQPLSSTSPLQQQQQLSQVYRNPQQHLGVVRTGPTQHPQSIQSRPVELASVETAKEQSGSSPISLTRCNNDKNEHGESNNIQNAIKDKSPRLAKTANSTTMTAERQASLASSSSRQATATNTAKDKKDGTRSSRARSDELPSASAYPYPVNVGKDVVSGKGGKVQQFNRHFRDMVAEAYPMYDETSSKIAKRKIGLKIYCDITEKGGRFLDAQGNPMTSNKALVKIMKALKDAKTWTSDAKRKARNERIQREAKKSLPSRGARGGGGGGGVGGKKKVVAKSERVRVPASSKENDSSRNVQPSKKSVSKKRVAEGNDMSLVPIKKRPKREVSTTARTTQQCTEERSVESSQKDEPSPPPSSAASLSSSKPKEDQKQSPSFVCVPGLDLLTQAAIAHTSESEEEDSVNKTATADT